MTPGHAEQASYDAARENTGLEAEIERLRAQADLSWPVEERRLRWLGLSDGLRILDCGCGPGFFTRRLAEALPSAEITALDSDAEMLARARQALRGAGGASVELVEGTATDTALADDGYDFAISRYLYQHLRDPAAAARETLRVLRPGGRHVVIDVDDQLWGLVDPADPDLQAIYAQATDAQAERGGDRLIGRRLARILRECGYAGAEQDVFSYDSGTMGLAPFAPQLSPDRLAPLVASGSLAIADLARAYSGYERFVRAPGSMVMLVGVLAWGDKPR